MLKRLHRVHAFRGVHAQTAGDEVEKGWVGGGKEGREGETAGRSSVHPLCRLGAFQLHAVIFAVVLRGAVPLCGWEIGYLKGEK